MASCITLLYPALRLLGGKSWPYQRPQRQSSCWDVHQGTKWNLSWTSDYQITDLSPALPGKGQHLPLFPTDKECMKGRSILQLTKQLANNRTDSTKRLVWRQWNKSAFLRTFFFFPIQQLGGPTFSAFFSLFLFLSLDETAGELLVKYDCKLKFKRRGDIAAS